jgi:hypothetical protein
MNAPLNHFIESLVLGTPSALGPITIVPLRSSAATPAVALALLDDDSARVGEVSEGGVVGRIQVESLTPLPLLLVAGEILRGARQNRQVDATLVIPPGGEIQVPVSCVERGRWAYRGGQGFRTAHATTPWKMRSRSVRRSLRSKLRRGRHDAEQGTIWADVDAHLLRKQARSGTSDLLAAMSSELHEQVSSWSPSEGDVGGAFFVGSELVGLEAFGAPAAWRAAAQRVLAGLLEEAAGVDAPDPGSVGADAVSALLQTLTAIDVVSTPGEGLGEELQGEAEQTHLAALVAALEPDAEASTVHLRVARMAPEPDRVAEGNPARHRRRQERRRGREHAQRMRDLRSAFARPSVGVGGPCLVVAMDVYERFARFQELPRGLPLPHRTGAGLLIWRNSSLYPLLELAELLTEVGFPEGTIWSWNGDRDRLDDVPGWIEVVSVRRSRVELRRASA